MPRPTREEALRLIDSSAQEDAATREAMATFISGENPDGTPFALPIESATGPAAEVARGYAQVAVNGSAGPAVTLTVPANSSRAVVVPSVAVRWRDDGTAPTATVGMPVAAGTPVRFDSSLSALRFIGQSGAGVLDVAFYG